MDPTRTVQRSALCRSRRELSKEYLLAKCGFDTDENELSKVCRRKQAIPFTPAINLALSRLRSHYWFSPTPSILIIKAQNWKRSKTNSSATHRSQPFSTCNGHRRAGRGRRRRRRRRWRRREGVKVHLATKLLPSNLVTAWFSRRCIFFKKLCDDLKGNYVNALKRFWTESIQW